MKKGNVIRKRGNKKDSVFPKFDPKKMEKFTKVDRFVEFQYKDLSKRNPDMSKEEVLEVIFNSSVLDDSLMIDVYNSL